MSTRGLCNGPGSICPSGPMASGKTVIRALGTIYRFMSLRARPADEFGGGSQHDQGLLSDHVRLCGSTNYKIYGHVNTERFGWLFGSSAHMARTLPPRGADDITRARAKAGEPYLTAESAAEYRQESTEMYQSATGDLASWRFLEASGDVGADVNGTLAPAASRFFWIRVQVN